MQYDGSDLIAEYNAANVPQRRYVHGPGTDEPLLWYEGSTLTDKRYLLSDERGSVTSITNAAGTVTNINSYDEYGIPAVTNTGRFGYTGQTWLPEIGMNYYKARMYSPTLGRFMQPDPIGYGDGMNLYAYVGGDPVNFSDPSGLFGGGFQGGPDCPNGVEPDGITCYPVPVITVIALRCPFGVRVGNEYRGYSCAYLRQHETLLPSCNSVQRGSQALGRFAVDVGGTVTQIGAVGTLVGTGVAAGSAVIVNPAGVVFGGYQVGGFANVTAGGGLITAGGATILTLGGSGKQGLTKLLKTALTNRIPSGNLRNLAGQVLERQLDRVVPEFRSCRL